MSGACHHSQASSTTVSRHFPSIWPTGWQRSSNSNIFYVESVAPTEEMKIFRWAGNLVELYIGPGWVRLSQVARNLLDQLLDLLLELPGQQYTHLIKRSHKQDRKSTDMNSLFLKPFRWTGLLRICLVLRSTFPDLLKSRILPTPRSGSITVVLLPTRS